MNRTIKEATVKTYHYDSHEQLGCHLGCFLDAYNFGKRLKTLAGLTPYQFICSCWQKEPDRFISSPFHLSPGLNSLSLMEVLMPYTLRGPCLLRFRVPIATRRSLTRNDPATRVRLDRWND